MKRIMNAVFCASLLMTAPLGWGQNASGSIIAGGVSCTAVTCVKVQVPTGMAAVGVQLAGTFVATVQFEGSMDGTNFVSAPAYPIVGGSAVTSSTAAGAWFIPTSGMLWVRARASVYVSGAVTATLNRNAGIPLVNLVKVSSVTPIAGNEPGMWTAGYSPEALTSGTDTQGVANRQWLAPVWVSTNATIRGVAYLIGTVGGTDKAIVSLYDATGTLLANSVTTGGGATVDTAGTLQSLAFTAPYIAKGPALYWVSVQTNGATAKIRTIPLCVALTGTNAAGVAVPAATIALPSSYAADVGPVAVLY